MIPARSYAAAYRLRETLTHLCLSSNSDVACINLMCSRVTFGCACRLAQVIDHFTPKSSSPSSLKVIEIAHNKLTVLPSSIWNFKSLERLDASSNLLEDLGLIINGHDNQEIIVMENLEEVDLRNNARLTLAAVSPLLLNTRKFPKLSRVLIDKSISQSEELEKISPAIVRLS